MHARCSVSTDSLHMQKTGGQTVGVAPSKRDLVHTLTVTAQRNGTGNVLLTVQRNLPTTKDDGIHEQSCGLELIDQLGQVVAILVVDLG